MNNRKAAGKTTVLLPAGNMRSSMPVSASKGSLPVGNSRTIGTDAPATGMKKGGYTENAVGYKRGGVVSQSGGFRPMTKMGKC